MMSHLEALQQRIIDCNQCPRLVTWRAQVAVEKVKRFENETYWGKAVPSFGDFNGELMIIGLAPAAHGANRTGRMFTGDRSGEWLYRALYKAGFANQAESISGHDTLKLINVFISAICHCAPPENKPTVEEISHCSEFLKQEIAATPQVKVYLALGKIAFDQAWKFLKTTATLNVKPVFAHGACFELSSGRWLMGSYHPSQQNTFTGKLTEPMFDSIFEHVIQKISN